MATKADLAILSVATRSAGVCTRRELLQAGVPGRTISHRIEAGFLVLVVRGLYEVPALATPETIYYRAVRAHPLGFASHRSAARLWGFPVEPPRPDEAVAITVARPSGRRSRLDGVVVHGVRRCVENDKAEVRPGLAATSPTRTIVDLAGTDLTDRRLRHVVQTQVVAGRVTLAGVAACLDRVGSRGVAGAGRLRRLVDDLDDGEPIAESEMERRLAGLLPHCFRRQYRPPWYDGIRGIVDVADPGTRVIVEADGRRWHTTTQAMGEDRRRDRLAATNGWLVIRVTWDDVVARPAATRADIDAVTHARAGSPPRPGGATRT